MLAMADPSPRPPTWLAVLSRVIGPLVLALVLTVMDWANHPAVVPARPVLTPAHNNQPQQRNCSCTPLLSWRSYTSAPGDQGAAGGPVAFLLIAIPCQGWCSSSRSSAS